MNSIIVYTFGIIILAILIKCVKKVPPDTVYIVDRNTHYHKTVKRGFFLFNKRTDKITTEISLHPKTKTYFNHFESHDGTIVSVAFNVTYSAMDVEDVLYNLSATRRSIDDVIQTCMYHAVLALKGSEINVASLEQEFERNMNSQVLGSCINIHQYKITRLDKALRSRYSVTVFKPHKSRSLNGGYDNYNT